MKDQKAKPGPSTYAKDNTREKPKEFVYKIKGTYNQKDNRTTFVDEIKAKKAPWVPPKLGEFPKVSCDKDKCGVNNAKSIGNDP